MSQSTFNITDQKLTELAEKHGTPLFVYDVEHIRRNARAFVDTFKQYDINYQVAYASKAFSSIAMLQVAKQEQMSLDVVSEGELHTAIQANYPMQKVHVHGNNKSRTVLEMAVDYQVGCIVIDNFYEIALLEEILEEKQQTINALIRITPGIEAHTHEYILTGQEDSKFGFDLISGQAEQALTHLMDHHSIHLQGVHSHIGSQIFETTGFEMTTEKVFHALNDWYERYQFEAEVVNLGGGFGIQYTKDDEPLPLSEYVHTLVKSVKKAAEEYQLAVPEIWIEPGRSIVGEAAVTIYEIGAIKDIPNVRKYVSVNGGMTDNIRPALYGAEYEATILNKRDQALEETVAIAGQSCETGDMLIWDLTLPKVESGDLLAVYSTGAYGYAMASHYNRFPKAAVVFEENGKDQLVIQRESVQDLTRFDLSYE
ncbi:diaminopimelate decarboxylase [Alkalibacillus almallahensis]|uniref:diaminopimelate decarboxylase n=1 Tax=Alkalibacillus almallahensis TaxID=1379154 RepID=UPI00141E4334|nr:diaminopimelate decarboxylase [Alkalibacillus almallahensis]NIK12348.1 diaminopimelate decarboxylase [Alkalibacillus almallahensis]